MVDVHKIAGWLLGYPACCTAEYVKERTPEQKKAARNRKHHLTYRFGQELTDLIQTQGSYPEVFDYRPPSFTPCSITCAEAINVLTSWKEAFDTLDPEAGQEIVHFNRSDFPERLAYRDYLQQEWQRRSLEYKLTVLKKHVS